MKLFLLVFLLSSLLSVGTSASISSAIVSNLYKLLPKAGRLVRKELHRSNFSTFGNGNQNPPAPSPQPVKIEGLAVIKQYLNKYGFFDLPPPYTDYFDGNVTKALRDYQMFFNLKVTGWIDNTTLQQMSLPRCGVPDFIPTQTTSQNSSWPAGNHWLKGNKNITYGFQPESNIPTNMTLVIEEAFKRWSNATAMNFTQTAVRAADIKIGFYHFDDLFNDTMYGDVVLVLEGPVNVPVGEIRLDVGMYWTLPSMNDSFTWPTGTVDLLTVVMHHIGHLVGLNHSSVKEAVMYPYILPSQERKVQLSNADEESLQRLNGSSSDRERNALTAVLSSLSVGLACMFLLI